MAKKQMHLVLAEPSTALSPFTVTATGISSMLAAVPIEKWITFVRQVNMVGEAQQWLKGDAYNYGEQTYPDKFTQFLDELVGFKREDNPERYDAAIKTISNCANVCNAFVYPRRRAKLPFAHHAAVYKLKEKDQDKLLDRAEREHLTEKQLRELVREFNKKKGGQGNLVEPPDDDQIALKVVVNPDQKQNAYDLLDQAKADGIVRDYAPV